jgi:hypothetical protein
MPSSTLRHGWFDIGGRITALWIGVLAGPVAWSALLETNYILSYVACEHRHTWMLHVAVAVALSIVAGGAAFAWRAAPPGLSYEREREASTDPANTATIRARFMAIAGLALCAWFAVVIIAMEIPVLVLKPCTP